MPLAHTGTVSQNQADARNDSSKLTAGELASAMRRAGYAVTAADLKPLAPEWHHSGWRPGGGMGRTYFFPAESAEPDAMGKLFARVEAARDEAASIRYAWRVGFKKVFGARGRKRFAPVLELREIAPGQRLPARWGLLAADDYAALRPHHGAELEPYEALADAKARLLAAEDAPDA